MPTNFTGPYSVEIEYIVDGFTHKQNISCDVQGTPSIGDLPSTVTLETRDLVGLNLETAVDDYLTPVLQFFNTTVDFVGFTLWKYIPLSEQRTFITAGALVLSGLSATATEPAHQMTMSYRTQEGGIFKHVLLETIFSDNELSSLAANANPDVVTIVAQITGSGNWQLAKDTSYPIAPLHISFGENERVFKKRFRS
jgi:hypothetical protein